MLRVKHDWQLVGEPTSVEQETYGAVVITRVSCEWMLESKANQELSGDFMRQIDVGEGKKSDQNSTEVLRGLWWGKDKEVCGRHAGMGVFMAVQWREEEKGAAK